MDSLYRFRWWLASKIVGLNLHHEIDAAYDAGREYGAAQRFLDQS
jgi:hypothetical protein